MFFVSLRTISKLPIYIQTGEVSRQLFSESFRRYRQVVFILNMEIKLRTPFDCPVCGKCPLAIHIDGNRKLFLLDCIENRYVNSLNKYFCPFNELSFLDVTSSLCLATSVSFQILIFSRTGQKLMR